MQTLPSKRAYIDIVEDLLDILSQEPSLKTKLAGRARLDTRATHRYINLLLRSGLITEGEIDGTFQITTKGREFLESYRKLESYLVKEI